MTLKVIFAVVFGIWMGLNLLIIARRVLVPYIRDRIEECRWRKRHPGMTSNRRSQS